MSDYQKAIQEILKGVRYIVNQAMSNTTKCYNGIILSQASDGKWNVKFNGETHELKPYGSIIPSIGSVVKVFIPQNNMSLAFFM